MMMDAWLPLLPFAAALAALGLSALLLVKDRVNVFYRRVAVVMAVAALGQLGNALGVLNPRHMLEWRRVGLTTELFLPGLLLYAGSAFLKPRDDWEERGQRAYGTSVVLFLGAVLAGPAWSDWVYAQTGSSIDLNLLGRVFYVFILLSLALGLAQLEHILRSTRDPIRYQVKFVLIGLGGLGGYAIYEASQLLMIPAWQMDYVLMGSVATLISVGLTAYGIGRIHLREVRAKAYVSPQVLYGSLTFLVIGLYLLGVGAIGAIIRATDRPLSLGLSTMVVFIAVVGLVVVLCSRAAQVELRRLIVRHFYRSKYDYRAKWLEVTDAFRACASVDAMLDRLIELMGRTFGAVRISIWMRYDVDGRFHQVRSVNMDRAPYPLEPTHPVIGRLEDTDEPLHLEHDMHSGTSPSDPFLRATHAVLCVPIRSEDRLLAFFTLSREFRGEPYGMEDFDLLRTIANHVGMLISHSRLAEDRKAAAEMEALHRFSAFCLHDLKNLAARLSIVVKNAEVFGEDLAFQRSAMKTVAGTVPKMMALITKLSFKSAPSGAPELVDVRALISETVGSLGTDMPVIVWNEGDPLPPVSVAKDQFQQVLLNVILNARHAVSQVRGTSSGQKTIQISTERVNGNVLIKVVDSGTGISEEHIATLFHPFQTTKEGGLGLGLYQCKRIIEEYGGAIYVRSQVGKGTEVRIELPAASTIEFCTR